MNLHDIVGLVITMLFLAIVFIQNLRAIWNRNKPSEPNPDSREDHQKQWERYVEYLYDDEEEEPQLPKQTKTRAKEHPKTHAKESRQSRQHTRKDQITFTTTPREQIIISKPTVGLAPSPAPVIKRKQDAYTSLSKIEEVPRGRVILGKLSSLQEMVVLHEIIGKPKGL